jgi:UTP--glucose-1-phosphate uridylyltransferase
MGDPVLSVERVRREKVPDYGIVALDTRRPPALGRKGAPFKGRIHRIRDLVEKPDPEEAPSDLGIVGAYALTPDIFASIERTAPGKNGEVQLTDAIRGLLRRRPVYAFEFDGRRLDIGTKQDWLRANLILALEQEPWRSTVEEVLEGAARPRGRAGGGRRPRRT